MDHARLFGEGRGGGARARPRRITHRAAVRGVRGGGGGVLRAGGYRGAGYLEISREVASSAPADAAHLAGRTPSKYDNFVEPSVSIGSKSTTGPGASWART